VKSVERNSKANKIQVFTDGGSRGNPGPAAAAAIAKDPAGKVRLLRGKYLGRATNNFAEYQGVILAFEFLSTLFTIAKLFLLPLFYLAPPL